MSVSIRELQESVIIMCQGELDQDAVASFEEAIQKATVMPQHTIWVDCSGITAVSTAAMCTVLSYLGTIDALGLSLVLFNLHPAVQEKLDQAGLTSVLRILLGIKEAYLLHKHK